MLTACLLAIGNELLDGEIRDLNLHTLSRTLTKLGFTIQHAMITRDNINHIDESLKFLIATSPDILLCSGGLGPTLDDLTLSAIAEIFDRPLHIHPEARKMVEDQYNHLIEQGFLDQRGPVDARIKMATLPQGATPLHNPIGTAPGVHLRLRNTECFILPGVPKELDAIFHSSILPYLHHHFQLSFWAEGALLVYCDDEAELAVPLAEIAGRHPDVYVKSLAKPFPAAHQLGIRIIATTHAESAEQAEKMVHHALLDLQQMISTAGFQVGNITNK